MALLAFQLTSSLSLSLRETTSVSLFFLRQASRLPLAMKGIMMYGAAPPSRHIPLSVRTLEWSKLYIFAHSFNMSLTALRLYNPVHNRRNHYCHSLSIISSKCHNLGWLQKPKDIQVHGSVPFSVLTATVSVTILPCSLTIQPLQTMPNSPTFYVE